MQPAVHWLRSESLATLSSPGTRLHRLKIAQCMLLHETWTTTASSVWQLIWISVSTRVGAQRQHGRILHVRRLLRHLDPKYFRQSLRWLDRELQKRSCEDPVLGKIPTSYSQDRSNKFSPPTITIGPTVTRSKSLNSCPQTSQALQLTKSSRISKTPLNQTTKTGVTVSSSGLARPRKCEL